MINGILLTAAATVILVLYYKVKAWDDQQVAKPARSSSVR
jgi:hypothetical protein